MKIYKVSDKEFKKYGSVLDGYDYSELFDELKKLPIPSDGIVYEPSIDVLENCNVAEELESRGFGGFPVQIGYVGGVNRTMNCLEYHKSGELNIALDDIILILGYQQDIEDGRFDSSTCKAFLVPAGTGVEFYATTLHYAPFNVNEGGYRVMCVLPKGTNAPKKEHELKTIEDKMCKGVNKWLMAHKDSGENAYIGIIGENINYNMLEE